MAFVEPRCALCGSMGFKTALSDAASGHQSRAARHKAQLHHAAKAVSSS
uniref:Uncharacterized protein n=1 Tax=Arundo donax TaxID=35708 RepID=A0A0A8YZK8_ARUDO